MKLRWLLCDNQLIGLTDGIPRLWVDSGCTAGRNSWREPQERYFLLGVACDTKMRCGPSWTSIRVFAAHKQHPISWCWYYRTVDCDKALMYCKWMQKITHLALKVNFCWIGGRVPFPLGGSRRTNHRLHGPQMLVIGPKRMEKPGESAGPKYFLTTTSQIQFRNPVDTSIKRPK